MVIYNHYLKCMYMYIYIYIYIYIYYTLLIKLVILSFRLNNNESYSVINHILYIIIKRYNI